jgi:lysophospholipase L1-like esterase
MMHSLKTMKNKVAFCLALCLAPLLVPSASNAPVLLQPAVKVLQCATSHATEGVIPAVVRIVGDWEVEVALPGNPQPTRLAVQPPNVVTVTDERIASLNPWTEEKTGWLTKNPGTPKMVRLAGLTDPFFMGNAMLDMSSLTLRSAKTPMVNYTAGKDFAVNSSGSLGRLPNGRIADGEAVLVSYRYYERRIDGVFHKSGGEVVLRPGKPRKGAPLPPDAEKDEEHLANIYVPERLAQLGNGNLFPVLEETYPEPMQTPPSPAERALPRTLRRLTEGGPIKILVWGDSVTGGYLGRDMWHQQFLKRLAERFPRAKVELVVRSGPNSLIFYTAALGESYNYAEKILAEKPDLVISEFLNDCPLDVNETEGRYRKVLEDLRAMGTEWIILTPHYSTHTGIRIERDCDEDPRAYVKMVRRFAAENNIALADASLRYGRLWRQGLHWTTLMVNSMNHPDSRGMAIFVDSIFALFPPPTP